MHPNTSDREHFTQLVLALKPYLEDLVFIGGWLQELYLLHPSTTAPDFRVLRTKDADIATPSRLSAAKVSIDLLLRDSGFIPEQRGDHRPPATHYVLQGGGGFYAEFLAHRVGSGTARDGSPRGTAEIGGVATQLLPFIDLLLVSPWELGLHKRAGYPFDAPGVSIRIANPACYMAQKILVLDRRTSGKERGKDILYIHDTILLFSDALEDLKAIWLTVEDTLAPRTLKRFRTNLTRYLTGLNDDIREASSIARSLGRGSNTSADAILAVCEQGIGIVFGT